jgi:DNA repair protein RecN (Recombination protein N)
MLLRLHIRNYALIEALDLHFSDQLTIITGETGAGKSIVLGALGLVMGERADTRVLYNESEKCVVEARFDVGGYDLAGFFREHELDYDKEVIIRRELTPNGKSRAFVNDTPVNNTVLKRLTESLIDLHQQFDTLDIHQVNFQLRMIDALADNAGLLQAYVRDYRDYNESIRALNALMQQRDSGAKEQSYLQFQLEELRGANLVSGEQIALEEEQLTLANAEDIRRVYGEAFMLLDGAENSLIGQLQAIARAWGATRKVSAALQDLSDRLEGVVTELKELAVDSERVSEAAEYQPQRLAVVQERLDQLYRLQQKHGLTDAEALLSLQAGLEAQLAGYGNLDDSIAAEEIRMRALEASLREQAAVLGKRRRAVAGPFESAVEEKLVQLAMPHARLKIDIRETAKPGPTGMDEVAFLFASNPGSRFLPIRDVASGGELSRLTLCAKSLVADAIPLPTLIFDEIDAGISGDVSLRMGYLLRELSARHQVICITHTPQVAARAVLHYFVYKQVDGDRTVTKVRLLSPEERIRSIAVMLSSNPPSEAALRTAAELIQSGV